MDELYFWYNQTEKQYKASHSIDSLKIFPRVEEYVPKSMMFPQMSELAIYISRTIIDEPITKIMNTLPDYGVTFSGPDGHRFPYHDQFTIERPLNDKELAELEEMVRKNITLEKDAREKNLLMRVGKSITRTS